MKKITLEDFLKIVEADEALSAQLRAESDPNSAMQTLLRLASGMGYELDMTAPAGSEALSDDDLAVVTGGINPFIPNGDGELNPYSWFVTLLRRLLDRDDDPQKPVVPEIRIPGTVE